MRYAIHEIVIPYFVEWQECGELNYIPGHLGFSFGK